MTESKIKLEEILKKVQSELDKLSEVEDEKVKEVVANVNSILSEMITDKAEEAEETPEKEEKEKEDEEESKEDDKADEKPVEESKEEAEAVEEKTEEVKEEKSEEAKEEEKPAEESKEEPKEEVKEEKVEEAPKEEASEAVAEDKELSADVSKSLKDAAIELSNNEKIILEKEEVITVLNKQITELNGELSKYKESETLELAQQFENKVNRLVGLYEMLGIKKTVVELKDNFDEGQIDKLVIDLSALTKNKESEVSKPTRQTQVSQPLELKYQNKQKKEHTAADSAKALFDI